MKYSEDIKLEIGGKFLNGDYHKDLKQLTKDLDRLIKSAKSEQLKLYDVVGRSEQLVSFLRQYQKACEIMHVNKIDAKNFVEQYKTN